VLAAVAIVQGLRAPAIAAREVALPGLPPARDGLKVVQLSDLHLGTLLGERWLHARIAEAAALHPDLIVITGDLIDGDSARVEELLPQLRTLRAPLGVLAITGNHEFYAGIDRSVALFKAAGFEVLRDRHVGVAPGLIVAGIDDLTARRQFDLDGDPIAAALDGRGEGATIFLSHTPWRAAQAAARGVGLMLSGHTHDGQIWPFGYLVRFQYPYVGGSYDVHGMALLVSRGTGTWGPRMRLFSRSEITLITLRAKA
jgi:predicted MPP superfamily phosphohydrolase